jgi:hypothetical protein
VRFAKCDEDDYEDEAFVFPAKNWPQKELKERGAAEPQPCGEKRKRLQVAG